MASGQLLNMSIIVAGMCILRRVKEGQECRYFYDEDKTPSLLKENTSIRPDLNDKSLSFSK